MAAALDEIRLIVGKDLGYTGFFYPLGLQLIVSGKGLSRLGVDPQDYVASYNNMTILIQSVFFVDSETSSFAEGRSWGQTVTAKFQNAIHELLSEELGKREREPGVRQICTRCGDQMSSPLWVCEKCAATKRADQDKARTRPQVYIAVFLIVFIAVALFFLVALFLFIRFAMP